LKLRFSLFIFLFCCNVFAQIENFTLQVNSTNETCTANGSLSFSVSNTLPNATVLFAIYKLPNLTVPIALTSTSPFTGLTAGIYRVVATQSLGNESASKQEDVEIIDAIETLSYQLSSTNEICGFDGTITVDVNSGNAIGYQIISGPVILPLQASNILSGLTSGQYVVRVIDNCGEAVVQTYTLESTSIAIEINLQEPNSSATCNFVNIGFIIEPIQQDGIIKYPLSIGYQVNNPDGSIITGTEVVNDGFPQIYNYLVHIPLYAQQPYPYSFTIVDGCGNQQIITGQINNIEPQSSSYFLSNQDCSHKSLTFNSVASVTLVAAPSGFTTSFPINYSAQILNGQLEILNLVNGNYVFNVTDICGGLHVYTINVSVESPALPYYLLFNRTCTTSSLLVFGIQGLTMVSAPSSYGVSLPHDYTNLINSANYAGFSNLPIGTYQFEAIDLCGEIQPVVVIIEPISISPTISVLEGCELGIGSLKIDGLMTSVILLSAPSSYSSYTLPHDFTSSLIENSSVLTLGQLPPGNYVFQVQNPCGTIYTISKEVFGYYENSTATVIPNCGSFNIELVADSNTSGNTYWLQKFNTANNTWGNPMNNNVYLAGTMPNILNSISLDLGTNLNLNFTGHFRVLKAFKAYIDNTSLPINCFRIINEFDFSGQPSIESVNSVSCNSTFEVLVNAVGFGPLQYSITTKNGEPFVIENGTSNYFSNIEPAIYNFRVEDACGNIVNSVFEIINPIPVNITASTILCNGETFSLSVPSFSFLEYTWWKDNPSNILSTTNQLIINSFDSTIDNGTYYVGIVYPDNPNSCLNQVLSYEINLATSIPFAGIGQTVFYCGEQGVIDLNTLLNGNFDTNGTWTNLNSNEILMNSLWNSNGALFQTYNFQYKVNGSCNLSDSTEVTITLKPIPNSPITSVSPFICENSDLQLFASDIPNVSYLWTGPNGYSSDLQNPIIQNITSTNNGIYTVTVNQNNCISLPDSVEVNVNPLPEFELIQGCIENAYTIQAVLPLPSNSYSFLWSGPNAFSSFQNPVDITSEQTGVYSLTVTNQFGCERTNSIEVIRTLCEIPNVLTPNNDSTNETLNLAGFGVNKIEIYNRWGRLVFEKRNYTDEWHGQNQKGERLPDGTYFYIIDLANETKNGWIYIHGN
jgi:gliding motility-associated-like protein